MATSSRGKKKTKKSTKKKSAAKNTKKAQAQNGRVRQEIWALIILAVGAFLIFALFASGAGQLGIVISEFLLGIMGHIAYVLPFILLIYGILSLFQQTGLKGRRAVILMVFIFLMLILLNSVRFIDVNGVPDPYGTFSQLYEMSSYGESGGIIGIYLGKLLVTLIGKSGIYIFAITSLIILSILAVNTPISQYFEALSEKRRERKDRKEEKQRETAKQVAIEEKMTEKAKKTGREPRKEGPKDIKIEGVETPSSFFNKSDKKVTKGQQNIIDLARNDELFGEQADNAGVGLEPVEHRGEDVSTLPSQNNVDKNDGLGDNHIFGTDANDDYPKAAAKVTKNTESISPTGLTENKDIEKYELPPASLLSKGPTSKRTDSAADLKEKARKLEQTLMDFKVDASVLKVTVGPTVTRYEVQPSIGVKINSIKSLESDLALNLEVKSVRVVPMSSGKVIGIEAYNENTSLVTLRDIIDSPEFRMDESKISFALGKNISGKRIIVDLKKMPHLLIAGTTGSGKSVCINSILLSILYRATYKEVQMILIDPKVVELKSYNGIPHLAMPVVTDAEKAATALEHAVREMNRRYNQFADENVRNITSFNEKAKEEGRDDEIMPEIVIVIDELADLMLVASQKVQDSISRLAAMARAAGMHLIVATQQPLASIVTSVIKANIPSRIAFSVSSNSASRVILDDSGAERLLGNGDMLYHPVGSREAMRIQGSFVTDSEVHKVTNFIKKQASPDYVPDILESMNTESTGKLVDEEDDLYQDALDTVISAKQASTSMLQRRFRIGYNRAARLMEMLEDRGVVGPQDGSRPRKVLISESSMDNSSDAIKEEEYD